MASVIEDRRIELKFTQDKMAGKLGISRQYYNQIENNKKTPSVDLAKRISELLGVEWTIFFLNK